MIANQKLIKTSEMLLGSLRCRGRPFALGNFALSLGSEFETSQGRHSLYNSVQRWLFIKSVIETMHQYHRFK